MMKGDVNFKWTKEGKVTFEQIQSAIASASTLSYPNFSKNVHLYCYAFENILLAILTQPNKEKVEAPIVFMSIPLKKYELKYSLIKRMPMLWLSQLNSSCFIF